MWWCWGEGEDGRGIIVGIVVQVGSICVGTVVVVI